MPKVSRRGFLTIAVGAAVVAAPGPSACAAVAPGTASHGVTPQPKPSSASGRKGSVSASVSLAKLQDNVALNYSVTNGGDHQDTYTVSYVDQVNGRSSRQVVIQVPAGQTRTGVLYGSLNHAFTLTVGLPDGTDLRLGPVGEATTPTRVSTRAIPSPLPQPGRS